MFVSGLAIESKKISISRKSQVPRAEEHRPSSTELPGINDLRSKTINKFNNAAQNGDKIRNSSHNKIHMSSKTHQKLEEPLREYNTENRIITRPAYKRETTVVLKKTKKLELSKEEECLFLNEDKLMAYFRYYPLAIVAGCGFREELMRGLSEKN
jgi:hypothetical protein